MTLLKFFWS